jgi:hopanoid biosynthesis associated protein HpnK
MKQLIVNADDFGLTQGVNKGILDAHRYGIVTSTSLMANGEAFDEAVAISRRAPRLSVGVHLVLTQGFPVSRPSAIPSIVDRAGQLYLAPRRLLNRLVAPRVSLCEIEVELRAQIAKVLQAGIRPTHLDGHKHVHVLPGVAEIVIRLAQEFGIPSVRCPIEDFPPVIPLFLRTSGAAVRVLKQYLVGRMVSWFARRFKARLAHAGLHSPMHFFGLSQTGFLSFEIFEQILHRLPEGVSELMCHPGYADSDLVKTRTRLLAQRETEARALVWLRTSNPDFEESIRLISYSDLAGSVRESAVAACSPGWPYSRTLPGPETKAIDSVAQTS